MKVLAFSAYTTAIPTYDTTASGSPFSCPVTPLPHPLLC